MQTRNSSLSQVQAGHLKEATTKLQTMSTELNGNAGFLQRKEQMLTRHVEAIATYNRSWLNRMLLPKEEKMMLQEYAGKQQEAVSIILSNQNKSLAALSEGQVSFVREVVNTLLKTGRAGLKAGADVLFLQYRNQRAAEMQRLANAFYNLMEEKYADADRRPPRLREMKLTEIELDLQKWTEDYHRLQEEFSNILQEQV